MGSSGSKDAGVGVGVGDGGSGGGGGESSSSGGTRIRRSRSMGSRVFQSSCLGRSSETDDDDDDLVSENWSKENGSLSHTSTCSDQNETVSDQVKQKGCRQLKLQQQPNEVPCISSNVGLNEWGEETVTGSSSTVDSNASRALSSRSLMSSSRARSRFGFIPGNISFRMSRATSLGSSRASSLFSNGLTISNADGLNEHPGSSGRSISGDLTHQECELHPSCSNSHLPAQQYEDSTISDAVRSSATSGFSADMQSDGILSTANVARNNVNSEILADVNGRTPRNHTEIECVESRRANRQIGAREPVERSVRFSRTLSVGRLRDRVLRRSSLTDGLFGRLNQEREVGDTSQGNGRQVSDGTTRTPLSDGNAEILPASSSYPLSDIPNSIYDRQEHDLNTPRPREARYHDIMEHRTDFLERRRRIRSQVRALQRLGSRFENLSGHERSCILSGQHRTGRCSCRTNNRTRNPDDDTSARASISRIVMLAEALFEVLDEIHQQSVVLSSRPSVSSLGSVPAPKEVVESMPVKTYTESPKLQGEDVAQCYICLLEYEEGDCMRILPCHHEFHRTCIDKWLKEIHRVCPLCRGDVCRSASLPAEN